MSVVTIRGCLGSGAPEVGKQIAEKLQADYVDREIIARVAMQLHREEPEIIGKEMLPTSLLARIAKALGHSLGECGVEGSYLTISEMPLDDARYLQTLTSVVRELARSQRLVILGRGSQFILKGYPEVLHVLIVAPLQLRVNRVMKDRNLDQQAAEREVERSDNSIREFMRRYFRAEPEDPKHYDLVINTEHLSYQTAASIAVEALSLKNETVDK